MVGLLFLQESPYIVEAFYLASKTWLAGARPGCTLYTVHATP